MRCQVDKPKAHTQNSNQTMAAAGSVEVLLVMARSCVTDATEPQCACEGSAAHGERDLRECFRCMGDADEGESALQEHGTKGGGPAACIVLVTCTVSLVRVHSMAESLEGDRCTHAESLEAESAGVSVRCLAQLGHSEHVTQARSSSGCAAHAAQRHERRIQHVGDAYTGVSPADGCQCTCGCAHASLAVCVIV